MGKTYWLDLFTPETWDEASRLGFTITGFRKSRWKQVQKLKPGDILVAYLTKISRFCGLLEVSSSPYLDSSPIWKSDPFPARLKANPLVALQPNCSIPFDILAMKFQSPKAWSGYIRGSPNKLPTEDGSLIEAALLSSAKSAQEYPLRAEDLVYLRKITSAQNIDLHTKAPVITFPIEEKVSDNVIEVDLVNADQVQALLVKMAKGMNLSVWVGRDSRNKQMGDFEFAKECLQSLPQQFDPATTKIIEYIDVLWLDGNAIVAAFEIEHTTSIYSGLLRMADLVSMQPNIDIPLYIVAANSKREKVIQEINRPTFRMLRRPMKEICRYISYQTLFEFYEHKRKDLKFLKHEIVRDQLAESCAAGDKKDQ